MANPFTAGAVAAFFQVVMIDLALAGDNAMAVGMAAAGLPRDQRRKAIVLGLAAAVVMLIGFALITTQLLKMVGLLMVGGFLLLWVCWKMWRDLRETRAEGDAAREAAGGEVKATPPPKTMRQALIQILVADLAMSLDNVLAVAGAARHHPFVLVAGLMLSISITGLAATLIARLLNRFRWIGYAGMVVVFYVALHMIWDGARTVAIDLNMTRIYNNALPGPLDIGPAEIAQRKGN